MKLQLIIQEEGDDVDMALVPVIFKDDFFLGGALCLHLIVTVEMQT